MEIIIDKDKHTREVYNFRIFNNVDFVLREYRLEEKPPKKRKWIVKEYWELYNKNRNTINEPVISLELNLKLRNLIREQMKIRVQTWSNWERKSEYKW